MKRIIINNNYISMSRFLSGLRSDSLLLYYRHHQISHVQVFISSFSKLIVEYLTGADSLSISIKCFLSKREHFSFHHNNACFVKWIRPILWLNKISIQILLNNREFGFCTWFLLFFCLFQYILFRGIRCDPNSIG